MKIERFEDGKLYINGVAATALRDDETVRAIEEFARNERARQLEIVLDEINKYAASVARQERAREFVAVIRRVLRDVVPQCSAVGEIFVVTDPFLLGAKTDAEAIRCARPQGHAGFHYGLAFGNKPIVFEPVPK